MKSPIKIAVNLFLVVLIYLGISNHGVPQDVDAACSTGGSTGGGGDGTTDGGDDGAGGGGDGAGGGGGDDGCFIAGTLIQMSDDTTKCIEQVQVGDLVKSFDATSGLFVDSVVSRIWSGKVNKLFSINSGLLTTTQDHPIWTKLGWASIDPTKKSLHTVEVSKELQIGDILLGVDGTEVKVSSIEELQTSETNVYNLCDVGVTHTYFASGILVHNK